MPERCHEAVIDKDGHEEPCGRPAVGSAWDDEGGGFYPVCREHLPNPCPTCNCPRGEEVVPREVADELYDLLTMSPRAISEEEYNERVDAACIRYREAMGCQSGEKWCPVCDGARERTVARIRNRQVVHEVEPCPLCGTGRAPAEGDGDG